MSEYIMFNVANEFHPYGFHRDQGAHPGIELRGKLEEVLKKNPSKKILINLGEMKAFYSSFADGAFGLFIDRMKEDFFSTFEFSGKPEYVVTINKVFDRHKSLGFNIDAAPTA